MRSRLARISIIFASVAVPLAIGCSLALDFDESKIPGDDTGVQDETGVPIDSAVDSTRPDSGTDSGSDSGTDSGSDTTDTATPPDTSPDGDAVTVDSPDTAVPTDTADAAEETVVFDTSDSGVDTAVADTGDAGVDTAVADTGDAGVDSTVADTSDAGVDTGPGDTGTPDTGTPDTGPADTGTPDTGTPDLGTDTADATDATPDTPFTATLTGAAEVPPVTPAGTGSATFSLNETTRVLTYNVTFSGMTSTVNGAHIHTAAVGFDGPVTFDFGSLTSPLTGTFTLSPAQVTDLKAGLMYVNIHTVNNGGGEIRGQIVP